MDVFRAQELRDAKYELEHRKKVEAHRSKKCKEIKALILSKLNAHKARTGLTMSELVDAVERSLPNFKRDIYINESDIKSIVWHLHFWGKVRIDSDWKLFAS